MLLDSLSIWISIGESGQVTSVMSSHKPSSSRRLRNGLLTQRRLMQSSKFRRGTMCTINSGGSASSLEGAMTLVVISLNDGGKQAWTEKYLHPKGFHKSSTTSELSYKSVISLEF